MERDRELIHVPDTALLSRNKQFFGNKRWCLCDESKHYMLTLKGNVARNRRLNTSGNDMFFDEYSVNHVTYEQMEVFFCNQYLFGGSIDYFLSLSLRHKYKSVHARDLGSIEIPGMVNPHERELCNANVTYLPTGFYEILAGDSTRRISDDYNYDRCSKAGFTAKYTTKDYLLCDIITVFHR